MKKRILLTAGGTATTWYLIKTIKKYYSDKFIISICDINPPYLIPASKLADRYFRVPSIDEKGYYDFMLELLRKNEIEFIVPLFDKDLKLFYSDNEDLAYLGTRSSAPIFTVTKYLDKQKMYEFLNKNRITVPKSYCKDNINPNRIYFVKPREGFGSKNCEKIKGEFIKYSKKYLIQEVLNKPEFSLDVYCDENGLMSICRERIETKAGVSVKARFIQISELVQIAQEVSKIIQLPLTSCIQFMKNKKDEWCLTDLNFRLGAGNSMSSIVGFNISRAFIEKFVFNNDPSKFLKIPKNERFVIRVYEDILLK